MNRDSAAFAGLDKRVSALEAGAGASNTRGSRKEGGGARGGQRRDASSSPRRDAAQRLATQVKDLRGDIDAERGEIPDLSARVAKLESEAPKANAAGPDLAALAARVDKIEGALAAPKTETRVAAEKPAAADHAAPIAIIAGCGRQVRSGAPFGPELAALQRLGVDPADLAPLQAVADGAPTTARWLPPSTRLRRKCWPPPRKGSTAASPIASSPISTISCRCAICNETAGDDPQALGLPGRGREPARRYRRRARRLRQAAGSRASGGRRLADASPREAGGGRGAPVDPRGGDRSSSRAARNREAAAALADGFRRKPAF